MKKENMPMETVHPSKDETYKCCVDDHCFVVSSGTATGKVWLSKSMIEYLHKNINKLGD